MKGTVRQGTNHFKDVGIHLKGNYGTFQNADAKPSLTLNFNKFVPKQKYFGLSKLHLNNSGQDPTYLNEIIGRELFQTAGVPVGRACHATVKINGRDAGLYVLVEGYDKTFLRRYFDDPSGNLYDSEFMHDIDYPLRKASGKDPNDRSDLEALLAATQEYDPVERMRRLEKLLNIDEFISYMAVELMIRHFDGYSISKNNYWLYHDPSSGKFHIIPHGMDQLFIQPQASLFPEGKGLVAKTLLQSSEGLNTFRKTALFSFTNLFRTASNILHATIPTINPYFNAADRSTRSNYLHEVERFKVRIQSRAEHIRGCLKCLLPESTQLRVGEAASLTNWFSSVESGKGKMSETLTEHGEKMLHINNSSGTAFLHATWQCPLTIGKGVYACFARVISEEAVFLGPSSPVNLVVAGIPEFQTQCQIQTPNVAEFLSVFTLETMRGAVPQINVSLPGGINTIRIEQQQIRRLE